MKENKNGFKFRFKKHSRGKLIKFDLKQLEPYRIEARHDFLCFLKQQLERANNCEILFEHEVRQENVKWTDEINKKEIGKQISFLELMLRRAISDFCQYSINLSAVSNYKQIMAMLEFYYEQKDSDYSQE